LSSQKTCDEPLFESNSSLAMASVPKALKGSTGLSRNLEAWRGGKTGAGREGGRQVRGSEKRRGGGV
jgi:hypothetical protein